MLVQKYTDVDAEEVTTEGAHDAFIRWLIGKDSPAPNFHMRLIELQPGGYTPFHHHPYEHEIFVFEGTGKLLNDRGEEFDLEPGAFCLVMPDEEHQFHNTGRGIFRMICLIPRLEA